MDPSVDRPRAKPSLQQLLTRDDSMLSLRKARDDRVRGKVANFAPYTVVNLATLAHTPDGADQNATELTHSMPKLNPHSPNTLMTSRLSRPPSNSA